MATKMRDVVSGEDPPVLVQNFCQIRSAVSEEMRPEQTDGQTDKQTDGEIDRQTANLTSPIITGR